MRKRKINVLLTSGMILMLLSGSTTSIVNAATKDDVKVETPKKSPQGIEYQTEGDLKLSGSAIDGLELIDNNKVTRDSLGIRYTVKALASVNFGDRTYTTIKLPREFDKLADSGELTKYVSSAHFEFTSSSSDIEHDFTPDEIRVSRDADGTHYLRLENPRISSIGLRTEIDVTLNLDLGKAVTDLGIRIPHAANKFSYDFATTIAPEGEIIDWHLVGDNSGADKIPVEILDPGYDLLQSVPKVHEPILDTDTTVTGTGYPGAEVRLLADGVEIKGATGVVDSSGIFTIKLPKTLKAGTKVTAIQNTGVGDSTPSEARIVQGDPERPAAPTVTDPTGSTISVNAKTISGKLGGDITGANKTDKIIIRNIDEVEARVSASTGAWRASLPADFMLVGDTVEVVQVHTKANGTTIESDPVTLTVVE